jgi:hypothetical protein
LVKGGEVINFEPNGATKGTTAFTFRGASFGIGFMDTGKSLTVSYNTGNNSGARPFNIQHLNTDVFTITGGSDQIIGNVGIGTTSPATKLDVSGSIRASTGILFGTDTAAANTLSDYEEGTFDFGIEFGGASVAVTYSIRGGKYTKIGRQVTVTGYMFITSKGTSTGAATITGLPFTVFNNTANYSGISLGFLSNITFADYIQGYADINTTSIQLVETTNAGVNSTITNANFANNSQILLSLTYFTS